MRYGEIQGNFEVEDLGKLMDVPDVPQPPLPQRINLEPDKVERGLAQLVLSLVELVRQLMEKQALRRIESGALTDMEVERLGLTLMRLEQQMSELKRHFELESLDLDLGSLGNLIDEQ